jgi:hypothetical protein
MVYLLDGKLFLNSFNRGKNYLDFEARGNIDEVNEIVGAIYGENKLVESLMNFKAYEFENVRIQYVKCSHLNVKVLSSDDEKLDCLEELIKEI